MSEGRQALRLLIVEDEPTQRLLLQRILQRAGYEVESAADGEQALRKLAAGTFQMLLTDWDMPGMNGVTLCRRARSAGLEGYLYILLLTSHGSTAEVVAGLEAGADDFLRKPAEEAELLARLSAGRRVIQLEQRLREANAHIHQLSITDGLVGTFNRRYLTEQLAREIERAQRYGRPLSIVLADLDLFKRINDRYGHQVGDEVLKGFAALALGSVRAASDWVARFGGEEFVIVLPEIDRAGAVGAAQKLRRALESAPLATSGGALSVTASFGVAELDSRAGSTLATADALLRAADQALYASKNNGRNCVS
jgi:two-component system, cell cycle response regulator